MDLKKRGENHHKAKLTESDVRLIREMYSTGKFTRYALAKKFGVCRGTVHFIVIGKTWKHSLKLAS